MARSAFDSSAVIVNVSLSLPASPLCVSFPLALAIAVFLPHRLCGTHRTQSAFAKESTSCRTNSMGPVRGARSLGRSILLSPVPKEHGERRERAKLYGRQSERALELCTYAIQSDPSARKLDCRPAYIMQRHFFVWMNKSSRLLVHFPCFTSSSMSNSARFANGPCLGAKRTRAPSESSVECSTHTHKRGMRLANQFPITHRPLALAAFNSLCSTAASQFPVIFQPTRAPSRSSRVDVFVISL